MIPVTKPFLPPKEQYIKFVDDIFARNWLTNNGPLVNKLEAELRDYLQVSNLLYLTNGTVAIQLAIKALELQGEIITTPFSYVATTSSITWEQCQPVFVDIDAATCNIDASRIEAAITNKTTAILATHCFGNSCEIDQIQEIADRHGLSVIYDAAHCFATNYKGQSIFNYGDVSTTSFHATKLFHTTEGGAVFCKDKVLADRMGFMRNFGHDGPERFAEVGINAKNSEFHAAMGLAVFNHIEEILAHRKSQSLYYLSELQSPDIRFIKITEGCDFNYAYFPVIFSSEEKLLQCIEQLNRRRIFPRRYFYPSLSDLPYLEKQLTPICDDISSRVLCLPLYHTLGLEVQDLVIEIIHQTLSGE
jgi:dTDP-4-amino-4,6-dideoxygalactose transaminase